jgi:hypothetical protein
LRQELGRHILTMTGFATVIGIARHGEALRAALARAAMLAAGWDPSQKQIRLGK